MATWPFYVIEKDDGWKVVQSPGKREMEHPTLWRLLGSRMVGTRFGVSPKEISDLPFALIRGRVTDQVDGRATRRVVCIGEDLSNPKLSFLAPLLAETFPEWPVEEDELQRRQSDDCERLAELCGEEALAPLSPISADTFDFLDDIVDDKPEQEPGAGAPEPSAAGTSGAGASGAGMDALLKALAGAAAESGGGKEEDPGTDYSADVDPLAEIDLEGPEPDWAQ